MCFLPQDEDFLSRALTLASEAAAYASPNPTVGCVLIRDGVTLGEGAHHYDARDHAEIVALKLAGDVRGATAYVTLEPCSHHGRTGPCADALIAAGIARCVVATVDPNPQVSGRGVARMRDAGIEVCVLPQHEPIRQRARKLNDAFAFSIQHCRPFITLKAALSVDGMLAPPASRRSSGQPFWLSGVEARADVQRLRHRSDAVLTGIETVIADNPVLTDRTGQPRRRPLLRVVLDSHLRLPLRSRLVSTAQKDVLVITSSVASAQAEQELRVAGVDVLRVGGNGGPLELSDVWRELAARDVRSVLAEAGSRLNGSLLAGGWADELVLYFAETELGVDAVAFAEGAGSPYGWLQRAGTVERRTFKNGSGEDVRVSGYLHDPWGATAVP